jgi:hypothetical protein
MKQDFSDGTLHLGEPLPSKPPKSPIPWYLPAVCGGLAVALGVGIGAHFLRDKESGESGGGGIEEHSESSGHESAFEPGSALPEDYSEPISVTLPVPRQPGSVSNTAPPEIVPPIRDRREEIVGVWNGTYHNVHGRIHGIEISVGGADSGYRAIVTFSEGPQSGGATRWPQYAATVRFNEAANRFEITYTEVLREVSGWAGVAILHAAIDSGAMSGSFADSGDSAYAVSSRFDGGTVELSRGDRREEIVGVWSGTYTNVRGRIHAMRLSVSGADSGYRAVVTFSEGPQSGTITEFPQYAAAVRFNEAANQFEITFTEVLLAASGWADFAILHAEIDGGTMSGIFADSGNIPSRFDGGAVDLVRVVW